MSRPDPKAWLAAAAALPLAACTAQMGDAGRGDVPAATVVGEPVSCIQTARIQSSRVHDDRTIDFHMAGGTVYRNTLSNRCPSLGFEQRFSHRTSTTQLCNVDVITVLYSDGRPGVSCGLGQFVPVQLERDTR